jgi:DNA-binding MarR family transcriptional regulator
MSAKLAPRPSRNDKTSLRLWVRLLSVASMIEHHVRGRMRVDFQTTLARFDFMAALDRRGELTLGEVSRELKVSNGNITGLATGLREEGLIENCPHDGDRRIQRVRLSAEGRARFSEMACAHETWVDDLFSEFSEKDAAVLIASLDRMKRALERRMEEEVRDASR